MINVAAIMGKMNSGGKKNLVMEYFRHTNQDIVRYHFVCDADSEAVPEREIIDSGGKVSYVAPYQNIAQNISDLRRLFARERFDIVHAYNSTMNLFALTAAKYAGVPVRISESLSMAHKEEPKTLIKQLLRLLSKYGATHYMACGEDCGRWQFGNRLYDEGKVVLFRTAIDTSAHAFDAKIRSTTRCTYGLEGRFVVGYIARFVPQKNPLFMLEIFNAIQTLHDNSVLLLIGDGPLKRQMMEYIRSNALENKVLYLGRREDIGQFYQAMDCFVLPSLYEGLPVVGIEAQCCGLPIYFSTEVTKEASFCELGHYVALGESPMEWAHAILETATSHGSRKTRSSEALAGGYDSIREAKRLQEFYVSLARKVQNNE